MTSIKQLPRAVHSSLRSSVILFDLSRIVEELIYNSIDAGACKVNVGLCVGECYVKVEDDGYGISRDGLVLLGERYATSKFHCLGEMDVASENFGFRGESLGSLSDISLLEVTSKARGRPNGYRKIIKGCKCLHLGIDDKRQEIGTTVIVRDLFYNQPVRRKNMQCSPKKVLHSVKKCVFRVALVHPQVSFRVTDIESGDEVLCTYPSSSPLPLVTSGFGSDVSRSLCELNSSKGIWKLSGYISAPVNTCSLKALQYVYINSRFVCKCPIHKLLNNLADSSMCSSMLKNTSGFQNGKRSRIQASAAYILNLRCPRSSYDLSFESSKTTLEFKDWVPVLSFIEEVVRKFWRQLPDQGHIEEPCGEVDEISEKDKIWKSNNGIFSPVQDVFCGDLPLDPEIATKKQRTQPKSFRHPSPFPKERAFETIERSTQEIKEKQATRYFDYTSQDTSPTSCEIYGLSTRSVVSQENCIQFLPPADISLSVESTLLPNELTGRATSQNEVNYNTLSPRWGSVVHEATVTEDSAESLLRSSYHDLRNGPQFPPRCLNGVKKPFLRSCSLLESTPPVARVFTDHQEFEFGSDDNCRRERKQFAADDMNNFVDAGYSGRDFDFSTKTSLPDMFATSSPSPCILTRSYYDGHQTESPFSPRCLKGVKKSFLRSCSLLQNTPPVENVFTGYQEFEFDGDGKCKTERKQLASDDMNIVGDACYGERNSDFSPKSSFQGMLVTPSPSPNVLIRHHSMEDLNVLPTDFCNLHPSDEVSFTEEGDIINNSHGQFGKRGSYCLSATSAWTSVSPPVYSPVTPEVNFTDEYAANGEIMSCRRSNQIKFREEGFKGALPSDASILNTSNEDDPASRYTEFDLDYGYSTKAVCRSLFPEQQSNDFPTQRVKSADETNWFHLESPVADKSCAKPTLHSTSTCFLEDSNPREELRSQSRGLFGFREQRSRRSHSAPPFHKGKSKFSTLYNCLTTAVERKLSSSNLEVNGQFKHSSQFCDVSQHHLEKSPIKGSPHCDGTSAKEMPYNMENVDPIRVGISCKESQQHQLCNPDSYFSLSDQKILDASTMFSPADCTTDEVEDLTYSGTKWRNGDQLTPVEYERDESHNLAEQNDILNISSGLLHLAGGSVVPDSISKDSLDDAKVLLQLDKKFIPVVAGVTLALIDQHAADERIRLEELRNKVLSGEGKSVTYLDSEQELVLPEIGYQLLQNYAQQIQNWGWISNIHTQSGSGPFTQNLRLLHKRKSSVSLVAVPCILGVNLSDKDLLEFLEQLADTDGSSTMPPSVIRVLNYKACRGAIMFGDALLPSECSLIVEELKLTSLCFQCAHGRPTTVPLVNLEELHKQIGKLNKWNGVGSSESWHGLKHHTPSLERARQRLGG